MGPVAKFKSHLRRRDAAGIHAEGRSALHAAGSPTAGCLARRPVIIPKTMLPRPKLPKTKSISQDDTHRLVPNRFYEEGESVLSRLGLPPAQMEHLFQLDDATNTRLAGEANLLPGVTVHELVFGVPHYHIINAAFTHPRPGGTRFSPADLGALHPPFSLQTAQAEIPFT